MIQELQDKVLKLNNYNPTDYFEFSDYTIKFVKNGTFKNISNLKINFNKEVLENLQLQDVQSLEELKYSYIFQCATEDNIYYSFICFEHNNKYFSFFEEDCVSSNFFDNKLYGDDNQYSLALLKIFQYLNNCCSDEHTTPFYDYIDKILLKSKLDHDLQNKNKKSINKL
jgi:hypothetical protein